MKLTHVYAGDIQKSYDENGDLIVTGKATGPDLDLDYQICDPSWLAKAMPQWMQIGNVREMHQPIAAGIGLSLDTDGENFYLKSLCVDPSTRKKLETGVLKGYSIGIKNARVVKDAAAPNGRIISGDIVEISYVDRPANPTAMIEIAKAVGSSGLQLTTKSDDEELFAPIPAPVIEERQDVDNAIVDASTEDVALDVEAAVAETLAVEPEVAVEPTEEPLAAADAPVEAEVAPIAEEAPVADAIEAPKSALSEVGTLVAELNKAAGDGTWLHDPATLSSIRDGIIEVLKAELDEFAKGEDENCDVACLTDILHDFLYWWKNEADEGETVSPFSSENMNDEDYDTMAFVNLGINPDIIKAATAEDDSARAELRDELVKALGLDEVTAKYEATQTAQAETIESLRAELEIVKSMAAPGGPAIRQTQVQAVKSAEIETRELMAIRYRALANEVEQPDLKTGYLAKALEAEEAVRALRTNI